MSTCKNGNSQLSPPVESSQPLPDEGSHPSSTPTGLASKLPMGRSPDEFVSGSDPMLIGDPDTTKWEALVELIRQNFPQTSQISKSAGVRVYERNKPSVVCIDTFLRRVDASTLDVLEDPQDFGSGIVWDKLGHILTNYHVIRRGLDSRDSRVRVKLVDQSTFFAEVVFVDPDIDVAILHINAPMNELIPVCVGNSADLRVGHEAYAFEHLFGYDYSFATGIISGAPRVINSVNTGRPMQDIIQTDAVINPGNSGALFDRSGNFIGMITSFRTCHGGFCPFNFAIPVDKLRRIFDDYVKHNVGTNLAPDQYVE